MKDLKLKNTLIEWFYNAIESYKWLSIKFEYNEERELYLVSFSPKLEIDKHEKLCIEIMDFEDKLNALYGDDAPLFCDEEEYFKLSDKAELFPQKPVSFKETMPLPDCGTNIVWQPSCNQMEITSENYYPLAA